MSTEMTSYEQALGLITDMPFSEKLRLNSDIAALLKKEGKSGAVGKAAKKERKAKDPDAPKREAAAGTLAWIAFVKHCKETMAERFTEVSKESEKLTICKAIRAEDGAAYDAFVKNFKEEYKPTVASASADAESEAEPESEAAESESEAAPAPKDMTPAEKMAKAKAIMAATAAAKTKAAPAPKAAAAEPKPKKEVKKAEPKAEAAAPKAKKEVKKAAPKAEKAEKAEPSEDKMPTKEIDGKLYLWDPETNGLWENLDGNFGAMIGTYQPDNAEQPILFEDAV